MLTRGTLIQQYDGIGNQARMRESVTVTDTTAAAADFNRVTIEAPQSIRTAKAEVVEIRLVDDGTGNPASFYGVEADIDVLEGSYT